MTQLDSLCQLDKGEASYIIELERKGLRNNAINFKLKQLRFLSTTFGIDVIVSARKRKKKINETQADGEG